ncbi:putative amino acid permease YhdG [Arenibacter sp. NBRC 103722]|uniref:APC family permease n=1 Tax=Arenibacter sp. NBRC 103722 TaxID=1113929 RepID=UPI0008537DF0|nr:APC family permease [Arenibacter sp. NBRC 103722]MDX1766431.1 APC family permease [Arenibacter troitsensis]GBF21588.1 putative amino acid permease YhdG [Arenibacter sp. NBRC 103722]|tara:strand:- start:2354 stop:4084 length:1731 start_codon:yes stop_codon:yes gene_type:complete
MSKKLNQLEATAVCGNDISSSCLYVSALAIVYSGQYAWIALLMVAGVLFFFRGIYGEVVGALPLNGGAYNALLNTTKKSTASLAASLTVLSYMATAVISASEAVKYMHSIWVVIPIIPMTIALLLIFMGLVILGIGESSKVAIAIFVFHLFSLSLLCGFSIYYFAHNGFDVLVANFNTPVKGGIMSALFLGFSAAMLGISGFESSANYVEEQKAGVFPKTLRNMWIVVTVFNPLIAFLALAIIPMPTVLEKQDALLSYLGSTSGGNWLSLLIGIDAALVLSGAVLTSFVGVGGLMKRMALDRILPKIMLKTNRRGSSYIIFVLFFALCSSILLVTRGDLAKLAGVYTIAFLSVMILFGVGNLLLKINRSRLPRPERSTWLGLIIAIISVIAAILGNIVLNPQYLAIFIEYLIPTLLVVFFMLYRVSIFKIFLLILEHLFPDKGILFQKLNAKTKSLLHRINDQQFVYFTNHDDVATLNKVMLYIKENEPTKRVKIVAVLGKNESVAKNLLKDVDVLNRAYPKIQMDFIEEPGSFTPEKIRELSQRWRIPTNFMFIGSPGDKFPYKIQELGEVRLII